MTKAEVLQRIHHTGLLPVLRARSIAQALAIANAIAEGGVNVLEVTMTVPGAIQVIQTLIREHPGMLVGAGTVLDSETAHTCMSVGAHFVVSPITDVQMIELCRRHSCVVIPGALTPTEIVYAWQAGADLIKVFPASAMGGANYLKSLKAPFPHIDFVPTGGVSVRTARDFLSAGAFALGVGAELADARAIEEGKPERIIETARSYMSVIAEWRSADSPIQSA